MVVKISVVRQAEPSRRSDVRQLCIIHRTGHEQDAEDEYCSDDDDDDGNDDDNDDDDDDDDEYNDDDTMGLCQVSREPCGQS